MKKLILIVVCAFFAQVGFGQVDTMTINDSHVRASIYPETVNLMLDYKRECWNDSTVVVDSIFGTIYDVVVFELDNEEKFVRKDTLYMKKEPHFGNRVYWTRGDFFSHTDTIEIKHRTPTFQGFLNWLDEKIKR